MGQVPTLQSCFFQIHCNITFHLCLGLSRGRCFSGFLTKTLAVFLLSPMNATCLTHHILRDLIIIVVGDSIVHETVKYVIISILSVFPALRLQISSSAHRSHTRSMIFHKCALSKFHTHTKQQTCNFEYFYLGSFCSREDKTFCNER